MTKGNKGNDRPLYFLIIIIIISFLYSVHIRKAWFGVIGEKNNQHLTSEVLLFSKNWYYESPFKLWFGMFYQPKSVEFPSLKEREFYSSDVSGSILPIYLISKIKGHPPTVSMIMKYNLLNHFFITLLVVLTIFLFLRKILNIIPIIAFIYSLIPIFIIIFTPAPYYYFQNVYFSVTAGILPFVLLIFLELELEIHKGERISRIIYILQAITMFWGIITIIDFLFVALVLYLKRIIRKEIKIKDRRFIFKSFVFWLPIIIPILFYILQLLKFGDWHAIWNKILFRTAITEEGGRYTYNFFHLFWLKYFKEGYGILSVYLFLTSIAIYLLSFVYTIFLKLKKKFIDKKIIITLSLFSLYLIPEFFSFFIFKNAIAIHRFFIIMFCVPFAVAPFILIPFLISIFFTEKIKFQKKIKLRLSILFSIMMLVFSLFVVFNSSKGYNYFFSNPNYRNIEAAKFIGENTEYNDIVISPFFDISTSHLNLLAYSMKNVYKETDIFAFYKNFKWIELFNKPFILNIFIMNNKNLLYFNDIKKILKKSKITEDKINNFTLYKIGSKQLLKLEPEFKKIVKEKIDSMILKKNLIGLTEAKDIVPLVFDKRERKIFDKGYNDLLDRHKKERLCDEVSFVDLKVIPYSCNKYLLKFLFKVNRSMKKNWKIYMHGWVNPKDKKYLTGECQKFGFENWDFNPNPKTTQWKKGEYIIISKEIVVKPISYRINFGFYRTGEGRKGNQISLGEINFGK